MLINQYSKEETDDRNSQKKEVANHIGIQYIFEDDIQPYIDSLYDMIDNLSKGRLMEEIIITDSETKGAIDALRHISNIFTSYKKSK